jgi:Cu(I)/Ag(I) efflux system membrane fusion protein
VGDRVRVEVSGFENDPVYGTVIFLSPEYRRGNQIITLRAEINNQDGKFAAGMQASVIAARPGKNALALPLDAVIRDQSGSHIWIQRDDGSFVMRRIVTGEESADEIEIIGGVEEKENVVITGAYLLYSELVLKKGLNLHQHNL